jgi:hypothetical protein
MINLILIQNADFFGYEFCCPDLKKMLSIGFTLTPICFELFHTGTVWVLIIYKDSRKISIFTRWDVESNEHKKEKSLFTLRTNQKSRNNSFY